MTTTMRGPKRILVLGGTGKTDRRVVERLTAREPRDFGDYAQRTAATGVWNPTVLAA